MKTVHEAGVLLVERLEPWRAEPGYGAGMSGGQSGGGSFLGYTVGVILLMLLGAMALGCGATLVLLVLSM